MPQITEIDDLNINRINHYDLYCYSVIDRYIVGRNGLTFKDSIVLYCIITILSSVITITTVGKSQTVLLKSFGVVEQSNRNKNSKL